MKNGDCPRDPVRRAVTVKQTDRSRSRFFSSITSLVWDAHRDANGLIG